MAQKEHRVAEKRMKTRYKYIHFEKVEGQGWFIFNNKSDKELGRIEYYRKWRQYIVEFEPECVFNDSCLTDILHFLRHLQKQKNIPKDILSPRGA